MNNIFFPKDVEVADIRKVLKRHFDAFPAIREGAEGLALLSLGDREMDELMASIGGSESYQIIGEGDIRLVGTTIILSSVIIEETK